jgi:hypothetical protein
MRVSDRLWQGAKARSRRALLAAGASVLLVACGGVLQDKSWSRSWALQTSREIPAAQGTVKVVSRPDRTANGVEIQVSHLAPAQRVVPGTSDYVVWLRPLRQDATPVNLGVLEPGDDLKATFKTSTPFNDFEVFITAEPTPRVTTPSNDPLMSAAVSAPARSG